MSLISVFLFAQAQCVLDIMHFKGSTVASTSETRQDFTQGVPGTKGEHTG